MKSKGYTLWLMPKDENFKRFSNLIKKLAKENNAPTFVPHVTLLGEIMLPEEDIMRRTKKLVSGQKPFQIILRNIDYEEFYFRTLFVRVDITESLQKLHNRAKEIFELGTPPYMPHLSLLYGTFPNEVKKQIIATIGRDQAAQFDVSSVYLIKGGEVKEWKTLKEFIFS